MTSSLVTSYSSAAAKLAGPAAPSCFAFPAAPPAEAPLIFFEICFPPIYAKPNPLPPGNVVSFSNCAIYSSIFWKTLLAERSLNSLRA